MSFPAVIDNTIRKAHVTCETMMKYRHIDNLRPMEERLVDLHFGKAFATGVETTRYMFYERSVSGRAQRLPASEAIEVGIKAALTEYGDFVPPDRHNKTKEALERSLHYYFEVWPLGEDGLTPLADGIECRFAIDLPIVHPDTGEFIQYAGRYDMAAVDAKDRIHLVDEKTTSKFSEAWLNQWDLDTQMTGYIWAKQQVMPDMEIVAQIRGISVLKNDNGHVEIPITRSAWMLQRWYDNLLEEIDEMVACYKRGKWGLALHGNACIQYARKCDYHQLCLTPNPEQHIEGNYKVVVWNPLERGRT